MKDTAEPPAPVELLVCTTCRVQGAAADSDTRPGARLHEALAGEDLPKGVTLKPVECLSNCDHGCSVVLRGGPKRWTYVYGNLDPESQIPVILDGVARYTETANGLVPWRERPEHFRKNCIARIPPLEPDLVLT